MSYTVGVLLLIGAMAVLTGAVLQVLQYRRGAQLISRPQLILRLVTAVVLLAIIGLIFFGVLHQWEGVRGAWEGLIFWSLVTLLAVVVIFLAMADLRMLERQRHVLQAELYRAIQPTPEAGSPKDKGAGPP